MGKYTLRTWLALGSLSVVVLGAGFFAVSNDSVVIGENRVETNDSAPVEEALDIQIAEAYLAPGEMWPTCLGPNINWQDMQIPAAFDTSIDVGPGERVYEGSVVCLRRLDTVDASANITGFVAQFNQTDPTCGNGESEAMDDCGFPGAVGEISQYVTWETVLDMNPDLCTPFGSRGTGAAPLNEGESDQVILLTPGNSSPICVGFQLVTNMAEGSPGLTSLLTDVATWYWVLDATL